MPANSLFRQLTEFFRAARHLWGRCPRCGQLFRLSDVVISYGSEPPKDWLRRLQRQQESLESRKGELDDWQAEVESRETALYDLEHDINARERNIERTARAIAKDMLKDDKTIKPLLTEARRQAVQRSRSTLLGKMFERLGPFLQRFGHDPRDMRPIMDPIDYVVFDGLTLNRRVERITFVEVKSGTARPSATQKSIVEAVQEGRFAVEVWQFGARGLPLEKQLLTPGRTKPALPSGR